MCRWTCNLVRICIIDHTMVFRETGIIAPLLSVLLATVHLDWIPGSTTSSNLVINRITDITIQPDLVIEQAIMVFEATVSPWLHRLFILRIIKMPTLYVAIQLIHRGPFPQLRLYQTIPILMVGKHYHAMNQQQRLMPLKRNPVKIPKLLYPKLVLL